MFNEKELDEFLRDIEYVSSEVEGIIKGDIDVEQIKKSEEQQKALEAQKIARELEEKQKAEEEKKRGRKGKGIKFDTYKSYCPNCQREFEREREMCYVCGRKCISSEKRKQDLLSKVEELKKERAEKAEKKVRWENWQKTQAMLYKRTATNYKKWDYFDDYEEEAEPEFIPPDNDPNFKALELDMKERAEKRKQELAIATELREQGNAFFKEGKYNNAILKYEEAQNVKKDWMILYTNSAIARIKIEDYEGAIKDCSRVLDYYEVFEDGYEKSKDVCFKALIRRGEALRHQKKYTEAIKDLTQALDLKDDEEIERILNMCREEANIAGQELEEIKVEEIQSAEVIIEQLNSEEKILGFRQSGGYIVLFKRILESKDIEALKVLEFLMGDENKYAQLEPLIANVYDKKRTGAIVMLESIDRYINDEIFHSLAKILCLAVENKVIREEIVKHSATTKGKKFCRYAVEIFIKRPSKSFSPIITNLSLSTYKSSFERKPNPGNIKAIIRHQWNSFYPAFQRLLDNPESLREATGMLCNLAADQKIKSLCMGQHRLMTVCNEIINNGTNSLQIENALGFLINCATLPAPLEKLEEFYQEFISGVIRLINLQTGIQSITYRSFLLLFRLLFAKPELSDTVCQNSTVMELIFRALENPDTIDISVKIITIGSSQYNFCRAIPIQKILEITQKSIAEFLSGKKIDDRMGNLGLCVGKIADKIPSTSTQFMPLIEGFVSVIKEKLGPARKNVAIGLSKLANNEETKEELRKFHGFEILNSVIGHLDNK
ncbi:unnamed protein product [Blepharisma stoltei]|uniref:Uncharacterized protein n=1 Tax=Blepharisma stoltei TaxID=1481888 RepID=A0AAU9JFQ3_9CILI|nr:unnamed protein product [Blepharisma stoltei]